MSALHEVRHNDTLAEHSIKSLQLNRLEHILAFAQRASPYYKALDTSLKEDDPEKKLKSFPILTKKIIRNQTSNILTTDPEKLVKRFSSGSSGEQGCVYLSKKEQSYIQAQQTRWWEWGQYQIGNPLLQTGMGTKRAWIKFMKDWAFRTQYVHAFALSKEEIKAILIKAKKNKVQHFFGYASSLFVFAEVAEEYKIGISFKSVVCWGDKMFAHYRKKIETIFNTKVFETYGCTEGFMIASQYDNPYLYIMSPAVYLELIDDSGNEVPDGHIGNVVVTSLIGEAFPLIRYRLGDLAIRLPREQYPLNRAFSYPLLKKVIGRDTDIVKTKSGKSLIVHSFTGVFEYYTQIQQFRVIQYDLNGIVIEVIPSSGYSQQVKEKIKEQLNDLIMEPFEIHFKEVKSIPSTPSGKPQIIKNLIKKENKF